MPTLYLVRHAEPAALWGAHPDPGLSELGQSQALMVGGRLAHLRGCDVITSPLARCRETSIPTQAILGQAARIEPAVGEVCVPQGVSDHRSWLTAVMNASWGDDLVGDGLRTWRGEVVAALLACTQDTIVFSHFIAINAAVSVAMGSESVINFQPGHASVTVLEASEGGLRVVELGHESAIHLA